MATVTPAARDAEADLDAAREVATTLRAAAGVAEDRLAQALTGYNQALRHVPPLETSPDWAGPVRWQD